MRDIAPLKLNSQTTKAYRNPQTRSYQHNWYEHALCASAHFFVLLRSEREIIDQIQGFIGGERERERKEPPTNAEIFLFSL